MANGHTVPKSSAVILFASCFINRTHAIVAGGAQYVVLYRAKLTRQRYHKKFLNPVINLAWGTIAAPTEADTVARRGL
jgi:hypothetical protein